MLQHKLYNSICQAMFGDMKGAEAVPVDLDQHDTAVPIVNLVGGSTVRDEITNSLRNSLYLGNKRLSS
jgi:hypothetical protein